MSMHIDQVTTTIVIQLSGTEPIKLPVKMYGGSANGGELGREAMERWQAENPGVQRLPLEFLSPKVIRPHKAVVTLDGSTEVSAVAYGGYLPSALLDGGDGGVPREVWPQWLKDVVNAVLSDVYGIQPAT